MIHRGIALLVFPGAGRVISRKRLIALGIIDKIGLIWALK
jgi:hypothetical protein